MFGYTWWEIAALILIPAFFLMLMILLGKWVEKNQ